MHINWNLRKQIGTYKFGLESMLVIYCLWISNFWDVNALKEKMVPTSQNQTHTRPKSENSWQLRSGRSCRSHRPGRHCSTDKWYYAWPASASGGLQWSSKHIKNIARAFLPFLTHVSSDSHYLGLYWDRKRPTNLELRGYNWSIKRKVTSI